MKKLRLKRKYKHRASIIAIIIDAILSSVEEVAHTIQDLFMKVVKFVKVLAYSFLFTLFIIIFKVENPEVALYDKTVEALITQGNLSSEDEALDCFPTLKDVKSKMTKVDYYDFSIQSKMTAPAPDVTEAESKQLIEYVKKVRQLRRSIRQELNQLIYAQQIKLP